jgi:hypothetical protein
MPFCPPQIPYGQNRARTRASAVGGWRLTVLSMARPTYTPTHTHTNTHTYSPTYIVANLLSLTYTCHTGQSEITSLFLFNHSQYGSMFFNVAQLLVTRRAGFDFM